MECIALPQCIPYPCQSKVNYFNPSLGAIGIPVLISDVGAAQQSPHCIMMATQVARAAAHLLLHAGYLRAPSQMRRSDDTWDVLVAHFQHRRRLLSSTMTSRLSVHLFVVAFIRAPFSMGPNHPL